MRVCGQVLHGYVDSETGLPAPNDFTSESETYMRCALLMALGSVRAKVRRVGAAAGSVPGCAVPGYAVLCCAVLCCAVLCCATNDCFC